MKKKLLYLEFSDVFLDLLCLGFCLFKDSGLIKSRCEFLFYMFKHIFYFFFSKLTNQLVSRVGKELDESGIFLNFQDYGLLVQ